MYFLVLVVFFILLIFVDKHDLLTQWRLKNSVERLEHDKAYYETEIEKAKQDKENIELNKEQFAREKYHMHKSDEEVFIIEEENEKWSPFGLIKNIREPYLCASFQQKEWLFSPKNFSIENGSTRQ